MNPSTLMAIAALFTASCLVRIVPALVRVPLPGSLQRCLERVLPVAVFINFALYIAYSEISRAPSPPACLCCWWQAWRCSRVAG